MISSMESEIASAYERCCRRFPTIDLPLETFAERVREALAGREMSAQVQFEDLFLALACSRGDRIAWECFAEEYLSMLRRFAAHACRSMWESEDLAHELIAGLLHDRDKLRSYTGRGSLAAWLRVAVSHAAIDRFRRDRRSVPLEEVQTRGVEPVAADASPDRSFDDARWGPALSAALSEEIRGLKPRERLLLGLYYVQGVPLRNIAAQFGVHEATASRWLEAVRQTIRKRVEKAMRRRHRLQPREIRALWRCVSEQETFSLDPLISQARLTTASTERGNRERIVRR
jgi:RNA polymerase sigma-70 factor (ECF subfamily)